MSTKGVGYLGELEVGAAVFGGRYKDHRTYHENI